MPAGTNPTEQNQAAALDRNDPAAELRPSWKKIALLLAGAALLLVVVYCSPLRQYLTRLREVSAQVRSFGTLAPLVLMAGTAVLVALGCPRLVLCVIAGMALGFWSGLLWAQVGTLMGNYALFLAVRAGGRDWAEQFLSRRGRIHRGLQRQGVLGVVLLRQLPLPGLVVNLACALLPIRQRDFVMGTAIGQLPQAIPCTLIGAGALQASFSKSIGLIGLAVVAAVVAWLVIRFALGPDRRTSRPAAR